MKIPPNHSLSFKNIPFLVFAPACLFNLSVHLSGCMCVSKPCVRVCRCVLACAFVSLKVAAQQLHPQGDGAPPGLGFDPYEAREDGRVDVVLHVAIVVCVTWEHLQVAAHHRDKSFTGKN